MLKYVLITILVLLLLRGGGNLHKMSTSSETAVDRSGVEETQAYSLLLQKHLRREVPVLCYHNLLPAQNTSFSISRSRFEEHIRSLADSGYTAIFPDDLYNYLTVGILLPPKPILFSFDDGRGAQYEMAAPILEKYGFRAIFFIMTISVGQPAYFSPAQIKDLQRRGHVIAAHTFDHPNFSRMDSQQWKRQLDVPKQLLESITQKPVLYFAYPYGVWTKASIGELKRVGYKAAFQLTGIGSVEEPLYTIQRLMVQGNWTSASLHKQIRQVFEN